MRLRPRRMSRPQKLPEPVPAEEPASIQAARDILTTPALEIEPSTSGLPLVTQGAEAIVTPPRPPVEETTTALMIPAPRTDTQTTQPDEQITESEKPDRYGRNPTRTINPIPTKPAQLRFRTMAFLCPKPSPNVQVLRRRNPSS